MGTRRVTYGKRHFTINRCIESVLSITVNEDLFLEQLDVKTSFLHGYLDKEIYMHKPKRFAERGKANKVC